MKKPDHQIKDALPRVLTDADFETTPVSKLRRLIKEGRAVIDRAETERQIADELAAPRPEKPTRQIAQRRPTVH
jgi:hypothetical protein